MALGAWSCKISEAAAGIGAFSSWDGGGATKSPEHGLQRREGAVGPAGISVTSARRNHC